MFAETYKIVHAFYDILVNGFVFLEGNRMETTVENI
jgi:hypothetical protein